MNATELLSELKRRQHGFLYHACTLETFRSYCSLGQYRSRESVENAGLALTPQFSDSKDKELGIYDHLFLNLYDQHGEVHNGKPVFGLNKYGPVLLAFDVGCLEQVTTEVLSYRKEISDADFDPCKHEVKHLPDFVRETFKFTAAHAFTNEPSRRPGTRGPASCIHFAEGPDGIPLAPFLAEVIVDALPPRFSKFHRKAMDEATTLARKAKPDANVRIRRCVEICGCVTSYEDMALEQVDGFFFRTNAEVCRMKLPRTRRA